MTSTDLTELERLNDEIKAALLSGNIGEMQRLAGLVTEFYGRIFGRHTG